ncbi:MAG: DUF4097 family beta strand repeat-containing protein [Dehalococcoidia bacterium]|nr:DUF4097 family beta strand repeat-containing protein [Dehalococcoidia bacterium]
MEYIRTFTREFPIGGEAELSAESRSGTMTVRGEDTDVARVEVVARLWADNDSEADEQADLIDRGIRQEDRRLTIRAATLLRPRPLIFFGRGPRVDYQVTVPAATEAKVTSRSGRVEIEGVSGPVEVEARSGRVGLRDIGGDVKISSRSGSVQAESVGGSLQVETRSGGVRVVRCEGDATIQARSGSVHVEDVGGKLRIDSRSGAVRYEGAVHDSFDIEVSAGAIRLAVDASSVFFLDAESRAGSVRSSLPLRRGAGSGDKGPTVRLRTSAGSIQIAPR